MKEILRSCSNAWGVPNRLSVPVSAESPKQLLDDTYGLLSEPGNVQELAATILASLNREWDHEAIIRYSSQFTWETIAREILGVYAKVLRKETGIPVNGDQLR